jgi:hypothetical protein
VHFKEEKESLDKLLLIKTTGEFITGSTDSLHKSKKGN